MKKNGNNNNHKKNANNKTPSIASIIENLHEKEKIILVELERIKIRDRFRTDFGDIESLAVSISKHGLLHPIIIDDDYVLLAGERRYKACQDLGLKKIPVKMKKDLTEFEKRELELEENIKRKNFTWQEEVMATKELDELKRRKEGSTIKGHGGGWGLRDTAATLNESIGTVSLDIKLADAFKIHPELKEFSTKKAAMKRLRKLEATRMRDLIAEKSVDEIADIKGDVVKCGDSSIMMQKIKSGTVHLIVTDPPFAVDLDKSAKQARDWKEIYEDSEYIVMNTLDKVFRESFRVLADNSHMYVFFAVEHYAVIRQLLESAGFRVSPCPLIWNKISGGAIGGMGDTSYANAYESIFFCVKGKKTLAKSAHTNVLTIKRVPPQYKFHPTQKPTILLRILIEQSSEVGDLVLDPFAGSGSTLLAAIELHREAMGFELDKDMTNKANLYINEQLTKMQKSGVLIDDEEDEIVEEPKEKSGKTRVKVNPVSELKTYVGLTPGTPAWLDYWEAHPEEQSAMLVYQEKLEEVR